MRHENTEANDKASYPHELTVNISELADALDDGSVDTSEVCWVLDRSTGEITSFLMEYLHQAESVLEEAGLSEDGLPDRAAFEQACQDEPEWQREMMWEALVIDQEYGGRFLAIPGDDSHEAFRDMEEYVDTLPLGRLRERLEEALQGSPPVSPFQGRDRKPGQFESWERVKRQRLCQRAKKWLEENDLEAELVLDPYDLNAGVKIQPTNDKASG